MALETYTPQEKRRLDRLKNRLLALAEEFEELDYDIAARMMRLTRKQRIELAQMEQHSTESYAQRG